jgi:hypothetical protein
MLLPSCIVLIDAFNWRYWTSPQYKPWAAHMRIPFIVACLVIGLALPVAAEDRQPWASAGDWSILVDASVGNGCLMRKEFPDGIVAEFGYVPDRKGGFFAALSENWTGIEPGSGGIVKFITEETKFAGDVEMIEADGRFGGWAFFNNPAFVTEIAARRSITVIGPEGGTFDLDLRGTSRAITMLKECQASQP